MARSDDEEPQKPLRFQIGQSLDSLSVDELDLAVSALEAEIQRLKAERLRKADVRSAADALFKF